MYCKVTRNIFSFATWFRWQSRITSLGYRSPTFSFGSIFEFKACFLISSIILSSPTISLAGARSISSWVVSESHLYHGALTTPSKVPTECHVWPSALIHDHPWCRRTTLFPQAIEALLSLFRGGLVHVFSKLANIINCKEPLNETCTYSWRIPSGHGSVFNTKIISISIRDWLIISLSVNDITVIACINTH